VRNALASLPWVEQRTIETHKPQRLDVTFGINDKSAFSEDDITRVLGGSYAPGWKVVKGPTVTASR
jgi:hypothetical protein